MTPIAASTDTAIDKRDERSRSGGLSGFVMAGALPWAGLSGQG
jgi:hypothetical protein